mgnify:CR=1 FL=1
MPGKLGKTAEQRQAMLRNQASELLWYGKITTTEARAKLLFVERFNFLQVAELCHNRTARRKLFRAVFYRRSGNFLTLFICFNDFGFLV